MSTDTQHSESSAGENQPTSVLMVVLAWLIVGIPLAYGLWQTLVKAFELLG